MNEPEEAVEVWGIEIGWLQYCCHDTAGCCIAMVAMEVVMAAFDVTGDVARKNEGFVEFGGSIDIGRIYIDF